MVGSTLILNATTSPPARKEESEVEPICESGPANVDEQILFVLTHPAMSEWLKDSLRAVLTMDPISAVNDVEILSLIIRRRAGEINQTGPCN